MSASINKVILFGNIGSDVKFKQHSATFSTARFSLATTESWKDADRNRKERTDWHQIEALGRLAEIVNTYGKKGQTVYVEGKLRTDRVEREGGGFDYFTKVEIEKFQIIKDVNGARDGGRGQDEPGDAGGNGDAGDSGFGDAGGLGGDDAGAFTGAPSAAPSPAPASAGQASSTGVPSWRRSARRG